MHQTKKNKIAIFDIVNVKIFFCEKGGSRYPKDAVLTNFTGKHYLDQYKDLKLFYKGYVEETLINPFISFSDMQIKYPFQVIDLRHQVDHISPEKTQLFEEISVHAANVNARIFVILIRHRQIEMISYGNKIIEVKVI